MALSRCSSPHCGKRPLDRSRQLVSTERFHEYRSDSKLARDCFSRALPGRERIGGHCNDGCVRERSGHTRDRQTSGSQGCAYVDQYHLARSDRVRRRVGDVPFHESIAGHLDPFCKQCAKRSIRL
jgi:hypothetical protein